jgi:hypothetical protein
MAINRNSNPYYDDFSENKNFYQILFRPGFSVQARELTQLQSILKDQIAKFGGHIFKHGSVVLPGNSNSDLNICYVKINATVYDVASLEGKYVTGGTSGLYALIRKGIAATSTDPATLYVSYYNSGLAGQKVFDNAEVLTVTGIATTFTTASSAACGASSMAFINKGVFFVNGTFVTCAAQSVVIGKYTATPSAHVLLKISETIVNSDDDSSLLDPAQGSYNYAAPGADRLKINLDFTTLPLGSVIGDDYIEIMRFNEGILEEHLRYPKYNELEKGLARRTYDESGDYVVNGLTVSVREHLKSNFNNGRYDEPIGDKDKLVYTVEPGKAYIRGFENEKISKTELVVDRARDADHVKTGVINLNPSYGQYFYVSNIVSLPAFGVRTTVNLVDSWPSGVNVIGTADVLSIDYLESNTTDSNALFKLFVYNVTMSAGKDVADVGGINWSGGSCSVLNKYSVIPNNSTEFVADETITYSTRTAKVRKYIRSTSTLYAYKNTTLVDVPVIGDTVTAGSGAGGRIIDVTTLEKNTNDNLFVQLPLNSTYRVKNVSDVSDMSYKTYHEATVTITGGTGSFSVTGKTIDPVEQGSFLITSAAGVHPNSTATVAVDGLSVSFAGISPASTTIKVLAAATKAGASNGAPKTKILVLSQSDAGLTPSATINLTKADGVRLRTVTSTVDGNVTDRYTFDNGQRDYAYLLASISLKSNAVAPTGTLTVVYDYFSHNPGDYFSIDSYESSGLADYYDSPLLSYKSKTTGRTYNLRNVLDFRPRAGLGNSFAGAGAVINEVVQNDSRITTSAKHYVGRIDALVMEKDGDLVVVKGTPDDSPKTPPIPAESLYLSQLAVPAYTFRSSTVIVTNQDNRVYTMKDVGKIDKRLTNLEDYVLLSRAETDLVNEDIIDAKTGLSRFKSGYLVDSFLNPNAISDIYNPDFKVAYISGNIVPQFEVIESRLVATANECTTTGSSITLPYTHVPLAKQPVSSKITNINPFSVFSWTGTMILTPSSDTWTEVENLGAIVNEVTETVEVRRPWTWVPPSGANVSFPPAPLPVSPAPAQPWEPSSVTGGDFNRGDAAFGGGDVGGDGSGKILCTAMNDYYGLPYRENKIWLLYSNKMLTPAHQTGYHMLFLPMVRYAYKTDYFGHTVLRKALEWMAVTRTADLQAELNNSNPRPVIRMVRKISEAIVYAIGSAKKKVK